MGEPVFGFNTYGVCCGALMACQTTRVIEEGEARYRQRYWVCSECGAREKTVDEIPKELSVKPEVGRVVAMVSRSHGHDDRRRH